MTEEQREYDISILRELKDKARRRDLGIKSIRYYYALRHAIEEMESKGEADHPYRFICQWCGLEWWDSVPSPRRCPYCRGERNTHEEH